MQEILKFEKELKNEETRTYSQKVFQKGKEIRTYEEEFRSNAKKVYEELEKVKEKEISVPRDKIKELFASIDAQTKDFESVVGQFVLLQTELRTLTLQAKKEYDEFRAKPPGIEKRQQLVKDFTELLEKLRVLAKEEDKKVPWQLSQCSVFDPEASNARVPFEGGKITDAEGNNLWGSDCYACGHEIQDGATGEGVVRYHCLDCPRSDLCENCFATFQFIRGIMEKQHWSQDQIATTLSKADSHFGHPISKETNVPVFLRFPVSECSTLSSALFNCFKVYQNRPCFGTRSYDIVTKKHGEYHWLNYGQVLEKVIPVTIGLKHFAESLPKDAYPWGHFIGISSSNRLEWCLTDFACVLNGYTSVGLHTSWPAKELEYVIHNSNLFCVVCEPAYVPMYIELAKKCPSLKYIVVMDLLPQDQVPDVQTKDVTLIRFSKLLTSGKEKTALEYQLDQPWISKEESAKGKQAESQRIFSLIYSSGTTGDPKGIVVTNDSWRLDTLSEPNFFVPNVIYSYSALAHGMDRGMIWGSLFNGGRVGFSTGNFISDMQVLEPVVFIAMPHVWNEIFLDYQKMLKTEPKEKCLKHFSTILGKRLKQIATGGAPVSPEIIQFMNDCFQCIVVNSFGTTETPGICTNGSIRSGVKVELRDVPEMGYFAKEMKGEICVRTPTMAKSYWRNEEKTKESFVDGWFLTGDVGEFDAEGKLHIIDRKKNILELYVQGRSVWVSPTPLESTFSGCPAVAQVLVHGERSEECVVAVIRPKPSFLEQYSDDQVLKSKIVEQLKEAGKQANLDDWCIPKGIVVEKEAWTPDNGLLTPTGKLCRPKLLQRHKLALDLCYAQITKGAH